MTKTNKNKWKLDGSDVNFILILYNLRQNKEKSSIIAYSSKQK